MSEYAQAGVDYTKIGPFKTMMIEVSKQTAEFPKNRGIRVITDIPHTHGGLWKYEGNGRPIFVQTQEGLGNLNWIAEWMYQNNPTGPTHYDAIARAAALLIVIDVLAQGGMPIIWTDEVAAGDDSWFMDRKRAADYARGCVEICKELGMALPQGESPALRYLVNTLPPVKHAPTLSGCIIGIVDPGERIITGQKLQVGDAIMGVRTTKLHSNGISLVIKHALSLPEQFMTKLPTCRTLGEEALLPIPSYAKLVDILLNDSGIDVHAILPGTGGGIGKLAFDRRPFTYRITDWVPALPPIMQFMLELGVKWEDVATTFNCGIGMYFFIPEAQTNRAITIARYNSYDLYRLGRVEEGDRKTIFEAEGYDRLVLVPPEE